jgi:hypothetical protein
MFWAAYCFRASLVLPPILPCLAGGLVVAVEECVGHMLGGHLLDPAAAVELTQAEAALRWIQDCVRAWAAAEARHREMQRLERLLGQLLIAVPAPDAAAVSLVEALPPPAPASAQAEAEVPFLREGLEQVLGGQAGAVGLHSVRHHVLLVPGRACLSKLAVLQAGNAGLPPLSKSREKPRGVPFMHAEPGH